jgi:hypothetical protein
MGKDDASEADTNAVSDEKITVPNPIMRCGGY